MTRRKQILLGINVLTQVDQSAYLNHMCLSYRLGRSYTKFDFAICAPRRMSIDNMRNFCAKAAIEQEMDYIWFIDDDVLLHDERNVLQKLLDCKADVAAGITLIRGYPYHPMLFCFDKGRKDSYFDEYEKFTDKSGIVRSPKLGAVGFSCCLIKVSALKRMQPPYFLTGPGFTEDVFFCQQIKKFYPKVKLAANANIKTEHLLGSESIQPSNRNARLKYDELISPGLRKASKERNIIHVDKNAASLNDQRAQALATAYRPDPNAKRT